MRPNTNQANEVLMHAKTSQAYHACIPFTHSENLEILNLLSFLLFLSDMFGEETT